VFWFGSSYWFIIAFIGLYVLSPVLNSFAEKASHKLFFSILIAFFTVEVIYGWIAVSDSYNAGYSIISFVGLYLLARYIRLYSARLRAMSAHILFLLYLLFTIIPAVCSFVGYRFGWPQFRPLSYLSPFVISASVCFFLSFTKIKLMSKVINWMACSVLSVYLIHLHPIIVPYFKSIVQMLNARMNVLLFSYVSIILAIVFLFFCVLLDKVRIYSWKGICSLFLDSLVGRVEGSFNSLFEKMNA
jgi:hypothetical protein